MTGRRGLPIDRDRLKAVVFDVDGTLYRQTPVRVAMLFKLLRAHLTRPLEGLATIRFLGAYREAHESLRNVAPTRYLAARQLALACDRTGTPSHRGAEHVSRWMEQEALPVVARAVYDGVVAFAAAARERGLRLGVVSDYPAESKLRALELHEYVDVVVSAHDPDVGALKPNPRGIEAALERLGVTKDEALYVGDRPEVDAVAAAEAGVACVIIGWTRTTNGAAWVPMKDYEELAHAIF